MAFMNQTEITKCEKLRSSFYKAITVAAQPEVIDSGYNAVIKDCPYPKYSKVIDSINAWKAFQSQMVIENKAIFWGGEFIPFLPEEPKDV